MTFETLSSNQLSCYATVPSVTLCNILLERNFK
jgi:hypothetical protein